MEMMEGFLTVSGGRRPIPAVFSGRRRIEWDTNDEIQMFQIQQGF